MGLLDRIAPRRGDAGSSRGSGDDAVFTTKTLPKFLTCLTAREWPVLMDLGPVVGSNVSFFGEQLGCKILVEDLYSDLDRHVRTQTTAALPAFLTSRFSQPSGTIDGILCWDVFDYLDRPAAQALAAQLTRILRPDGALLGFFSASQVADTRYSKYVIVDRLNLRHRAYPSARGRQSVLANRDIIRLFETLRVADSFLLKNNLREFLFRKPA
ncbi:MAG: hypothetical protein ABI868_06545 [Acidobacteriota bacterium]